METLSVAESLVKKRNPPSVGGQLSLIVMWSVMAGLRLDNALSNYVRPITPYQWVGDLILGVAFLLASIAMSIRLYRQIKSAPVSE